MMRKIFTIALFLSPFFFPFAFTVGGMAIAAVFIPSLALFIGVLVDLLYVSSVHFPVGTVTAIGLLAIGWCLRTFIRTHIMST